MRGETRQSRVRSGALARGRAGAARRPPPEPWLQTEALCYSGQRRRAGRLSSSLVRVEHFSTDICMLLE